MTQINNIEDLVRVLDDNPQWVEALRVRLLTRELIELPEKFAAFITQTNQRFDVVDQRLTDELVELPEKFAEFAIQTNQRFDGLETTVGRMGVDVGYLKGHRARDVAIYQAPIIARSMGLRRVRNLTPEDLLDITDNADTSAITRDELHSFHIADLIMEATDAQGKPCYIAVEVSFTVNGRDTNRALRNVRYLRSFTGEDAYAAVVGVHKDDRVQETLDAGEVFFYELPMSDLIDE